MLISASSSIVIITSDKEITLIGKKGLDLVEGLISSFRELGRSNQEWIYSEAWFRNSIISDYTNWELCDVC